MTTSEFIRKKNEILRKHLGLPFDLVPKDQIKDVTPMGLSIYSSIYSCPYCGAFADCRGCPMAEAGNECHKDPNNTWERYLELDESGQILVHTDPKSPAYRPMEALIGEFNESNGFT